MQTVETTPSSPNSTNAVLAASWISVEKELPKKKGYYIVYCTMPNEPGLVHYHKDTGWQNGFYDDRVTHWAVIVPPACR